MHGLTARVVFVSALSAATAIAQCATPWLPGSGIVGANSGVLASTMWDPDGAGPLPARLVIGGGFTLVVDVAANRVAAWDPATGTWSPLGSGVDGPTVMALAPMPNGDLVVAGSFTTAGGVAANGIARWNGSSWSPLGSGVSGVNEMAVMPNGDLVVGGSFTAAGGVAANNVARWDGTAWSALGAGTDSPVLAVHALPNGDVVVGGGFSTAGGIPAARIARWDGATWSTFGSGMAASSTFTPWVLVEAITTMPNGDLVAAGMFGLAGGVAANQIARWNGTAWSPLGAGIAGGAPPGAPTVYCLAVTPNGDLFAGGYFFTAGGANAAYVARWNGSAWSAASGLGNAVRTLTALPNGEVFAGGYFASTNNSGVEGGRIARWNGSAWAHFTSNPTNGFVWALATMANGDVVAAGAFTSIGGVPANRIARWNGSSWAPLGVGLNSTVGTMTILPNGDIVVAGPFTTAGGVPANHVARWNGASWSPMGSGLATCISLATMPNGDVVAGAAGPGANVWRWNGSSWSQLAGSTTLSVIAVAGLPNGDIVASGAASPTTFSLARWNGTSWSPFGAGLNMAVRTLRTLPNGDLVAGGDFTAIGGILANRIARWNGTTWSSYGTGIGDAAVTCVTPLPNGDLVAGGSFTAPGYRIARWNGASWSPFGMGTDDLVIAVATSPSGTLFAGGTFSTAGDLVSQYVARLTTTCPATAVAAGSGCASSGGSNTLVARTLPWTGSTFRIAGSGLPTLALVCVVTGFAPMSLPLFPLHSAGQQGCNLLVTPDALDFVVTVTGACEAQLALPNTQALAGIVVHQQMVPFEVDPALNVIAVTATNAIAATVGSF